MVDNQHRQIEGYRDLQQDEIDLMNKVKEAEIKLGEVWKQTVQAGNDETVAATVDMRWANIAKTHFQEGFSALVRSIAKPRDVFKSDSVDGEHAKTAPPSTPSVEQSDPVGELDSFIK
jgi:hypothetical protein